MPLSNVSAPPGTYLLKKFSSNPPPVSTLPRIKSRFRSHIHWTCWSTINHVDAINNFMMKWFNLIGLLIKSFHHKVIDFIIKLLISSTWLIVLQWICDLNLDFIRGKVDTGGGYSKIFWEGMCRPGFQYLRFSIPIVLVLFRGGGTQYKRPYGDVPPTWVAKSASWYMNDPL